jgi:hypothetical protein
LIYADIKKKELTTEITEAPSATRKIRSVALCVARLLAWKCKESPQRPTSLQVCNLRIYY